MRRLAALLLLALLSACPATPPKHGVLLRFEPTAPGADLKAVSGVLTRRLQGIEARGLEIAVEEQTRIAIKVPGGIHLDEIKAICLQGGNLALHKVDDVGTAFLKALPAPAAGDDATPAEDEEPPAEGEGAGDGAAGHPAALPPGVVVKTDSYHDQGGAAHEYLYLESGRRASLEQVFSALAPQLPAQRRLLAVAREGATPADTRWTSLLVQAPGLEATSHLQQVEVDTKQGVDSPYVALSLDAAGAEAFAKLTAESVGHRIAIVVDGEVQATPVVVEPIRGGKVQLTVGGLTARERTQQARNLAAALRGGALPVPLRLAEEQTYGDAKRIGAGGM